MRMLRHALSFVAVAAISLACNLTAKVVWGYLAVYGPIVSLLHPLWKQHHMIAASLLFLHDGIVNVAIAYPFALLILKTPVHHRWRYIAVVVLALFFYDYRLVIQDSSLGRLFLTSWTALFGIFVAIGMLPFCLWLASRQRPPIIYNQHLERPRS